MRIGDRAIGIVVGILIGLAIVTAFVFLGSGDTIDDPSLSGNDRPPAQEQPQAREQTAPAKEGPAEVGQVETAPAEKP